MNKFQNWMTRIEKDNKAFKKANMARKRVMIAQDVIKALYVNLFKSNGESGYVDFSGKDTNINTYYYHTIDDKDVRDTLIKSTPGCNVCAKGALFTCAVMRNDKVTFGDLNNGGFGGTNLSAMLGGIFSPEQLNLIENNYEGWEVDFTNYRRGKIRLIAIMENIIRNKGTFCPKLEGK